MVLGEVEETVTTTEVDEETEEEIIRVGFFIGFMPTNIVLVFKEKY